MGCCLNCPDKYEAHFSLSSKYFLLVTLQKLMRGGPRGQSMDRVHEGIHGLGPQRWSRGPRSMFCIRPDLLVTDY